MVCLQVDGNAAWLGLVEEHEDGSTTEYEAYAQDNNNGSGSNRDPDDEFVLETEDADCEPDDDEDKDTPIYGDVFNYDSGL